MADGDTVKMRLTFWRNDLQPGDVIDVPADEVHRWTGFAVPVDEPKPTAPPVNPKPDVKAPIDEWRAYAVKRGMEQARAEKASKQECMDYVRDASDRP
ncbi:hypothetical protein ACIHCX_03470 [Streptomyces sp. NPDC052043]|uniref:hypothetical protein n=1 Tax=Streptomyces sp. NPDC052043 TaxID=3365684 RepID=UPI0037D8FE81